MCLSANPDDSLISKVRPFLYVDGNIELSLLRRFMENEWKLQTAMIVIPVLSSATDYKPVKDQKIAEAFRTGIKTVCYLTTMYFSSLHFKCMYVGFF